MLLDVFEHSGTWWSIHGEGTQCRWDTTGGGGVWVPDKVCREYIKYESILRLLPKGSRVSYESRYNSDGTVIMRDPKPGEKPFPNDTKCIDERYMNVVTYTLPDGRHRGGYKNFGTAALAAAKALGVKIDSKKRAVAAREVAVECARQALESYNAWLAGDCYGVCVEVFDPDSERITDDACWGYVGHKYAEEELRSNVEYLVKEYGEEKEAKP